MNNYFSSDFHLCHANVIRYDKRPFNNVDEMNEVILEEYNKTVKPGDNFYFLGDFCFDTRRTEEFLKQMNGNLFFIRGNHDKHDTIKLYQKYGIYLGEQKMIKIKDAESPRGNQEIVLNHYRMDVWDKSHHGAWHLFGHSHGSLPDRLDSRCFDVGCMIWDYIPLSYEEVKEEMKKKTFTPIDHHKAR